jgi:threonine dehydratase
MADRTRLLDLDDIRRAAETVTARVHRTPLLRSRTFSEMAGHNVYLKCENLQRTGSFKPRGALNRVMHLSAEERRRGVLTASAGNHAQGLAFAAASLEVPVTVVMPENAQPVKIEATRAMGAEVLLHGRIFHDALARALELQEERGMAFVHPCIDPDVVAGAGTIGLEIVEDLPELHALVVPIGGGGLISGTAAAVKALRPEALVWGVEPRTAPAMERSLAAGALISLDTAISIADGMAGTSVFQYTLDHADALISGVRLVDEGSMLEALRLLLTRAKLLTEPAGAAPLAAILDGLPDLEPGSNVVALLSGGNQDLGRLATWLSEGVS